MGWGERVAAKSHMGVHYFHTVSKLDWPFSLCVKMRILSCWFSNRSLHLPNTWVSGRTNMIDNIVRTRLSDANHLALNICELIKLIEFRGMWRAVMTWRHFSKDSAAFMVPLYSVRSFFFSCCVQYSHSSIIKIVSLQSCHSAVNSPRSRTVWFV